VAYDPAKGEVFVTNDGAVPSNTSASNTAAGDVSVISDSSNKVIASIPVGPFPDGIAYDPTKGEVFVTFTGKTATSASPANEGGVSVISDSSNSVVSTIPLADAGTVAYDSGKGELFVVTPNSNSTAIISDQTDAVTGSLPAGPGPFYIVYDSGTSQLFVTNPKPDTLTILSDATPASTTTTSSSKSSTGLALGPSYLLVVGFEVSVILLLGLLYPRGRKRRPLQCVNEFPVARPVT
jgi:YVTN family beta-propeller protein